MTKRGRDVAIIGGGITGLVLALEKKKQGDSVRILESANRLGGWIRSEYKNGFLLEHGPNTVILSPELETLVEDLGISSKLVFPSPDAKNRFVLSPSDGRTLLAAPRSVLGAVGTPLLSIAGKIRLLGELFVPASRAEDESVREFFTRRFGREVATLVSAVVGGIYAADSSRLSIRSALPSVFELERSYGSIFRGMLLKKKRSASRKGRKSIVSFDGGLERLIESLAARFESHEIRISTGVVSVTKGNDGRRYRLTGAEGRELGASLGEFDEVYLTVPAKESCRILHDLDSELASKVEGIPHAPLGLLHLAAKRDSIQHPLDGFGFLVPEGTGRKILGVIFASTLFPHRAPQGDVLLTCFAGGLRNAAAADVRSMERQAEIIEELSGFIGLTEKPRVISAVYHEAAIPNFPTGHFRIEEAAANFERKNPGIFLIANWRRGVGVPDRVRFALDASRKTVVP